MAKPKKAPSKYPFVRQLHFGQKGRDVEVVQQWLQHGIWYMDPEEEVYTLNSHAEQWAMDMCSGVFDGPTVISLRDFKDRAGLPQSDVYDWTTYVKLQKTEQDYQKFKNDPGTQQSIWGY